MHRFYLPPDQTRADRLVLRDREAHHAARVLRMARGDTAQITNGAGVMLDAVVVEMGRQEVVLTVQARRSFPPPPCAVTLYQAMIKAKAMDFILQKAVELGASRLVPIRARRSEVHWAAPEVAAKLEKWRWIMIDALKQCGSAWLPELAPPHTVEEGLARPDRGEVEVVGALAPGAQSLRRILDAFRPPPGRPPRSLGLWIGPEGDFTPEELRALADGGCASVTFGPGVLRSETAALAGLAIAHSETSAMATAPPSAPPV